MVFTILVVILFLLVIGKNGFHLFESKFLFYPIKSYQQLPALTRQDVKLPGGATGWWFHDFPGQPTILYCHGNAANISYWNHMINLIHSQRLNLFIFDYHGFGQSHGKPSVKSMIQDGMEAYQFLVQHVQPSQMVVWGESLGGVPAIQIACHHPIAYLALAGTFSHPADVIKEWNLNPWLEYPARLIPKLDNVKYLARVKVPVVIIHSPEDEVIPYSCALELYQAIQSPCRKLVTISGSHTNPQMTTEQLREIFGFCCLNTEYCQAAEPHLQKICHDCRQFCPFNFGGKP